VDLVHLYVILDVFSRYVPGWTVATRESAALAERLIADTVATQDIEPGTLTIQADRGSSMASRPVALLLTDLGVAKSHSRPHTSNDNPYSEAHFKTLEVPASRPVSARSRTPGPSAGGSSAGTTPSTATLGSGS
jgi:putative transposase